MTYKYIFILIFSLSYLFGFAQSVWAGDVNNNGVVNKIDFLYLGYAFGETGPARENQGGDWTGQTLPENWTGSFPNGLNFLYADCNGDGKIDELDEAVIAQNAGLSHNDIIFMPDEILIGEEGVNPTCRLINNPIAVPVNQLFSIDIALGDIGIPVDNLMGLSFILDVDPDIVGLQQTTLTFNEDAWLEPNVNQSIQIQQIDEERARLKVGFAKTDRIPVSGFGPLAKVSFLIEEDIVNLLVIDTVTYTLDSIVVLTDDLTPVPIVPDTLKLAVDKDLMVSTVEDKLASKISAYPNPNAGQLLLVSDGIRLEKVALINSLGQVLFSKKLDLNFFQSIDFQHLPSGSYWMKIYTEKGIKTEIVHKL